MAGIFGCAGLVGAVLPPLEVRTVVAREDYSFTGLGSTQWLEIALKPYRNFSFSLRETRVERFQEVDLQTGLGGGIRLGGRSGLETEVSFGPQASVVPLFSWQGYWYQGLPHSLEIIPGYRFSNFSTAQVHLLSLGIFRQLGDRGGVLVRGFANKTQFDGAGNVWNPAWLIQGKVPLSRVLQIIPSYSYRKEAFEAGAPGQTRDFKAHLGRLEGRYGWEAGLVLFW